MSGDAAEDGSDPSAATPEAETGEPDSASSAYRHQPRAAPPQQASVGEAEFGRHGWLLVGVVVVAFLVVPAAILFLPQAQSLVASVGFSVRDAYLVLPLVPAFLLGTVAVWAAVRARSA